MCLFPFGGGSSSMLIPPTDKGRELVRYFRFALAFHALLILGLFLGGLIVDSLFDCIFLLIGFMAVRNPDGVALQQLVCYMSFSVMDWIWSFIRVIIFFAAGPSTSTISSADWMYYTLILFLVLSPFVYSGAAVISYFLYKELKSVIDEMAGAIDEPFGNAGGSAGQFAAPPSAADSSFNPAQFQSGSSAAAGQPGFRAFQGSGHRLG